MLTRIKTQKSQILVITLIVLAIVLALGAGLLFHARSLRDVTRIQVDTDKAYSLARSGLGIAGSRVASNPCNCTGNNTYSSFGAGTVAIGIAATLTGAGNDYLASGNITSTGSIGRSKRRLTKTFNVPTGWVKAYGGSNDDVILSILPATDFGYVLGGYTSSFGAGNKDFLLVKIDASGTLQWAKAYGGSGDEEMWDLQQATGGGYILVGWTESFGMMNGSSDFFLVKTDDSGNLVWAKTYGGLQLDKAWFLQKATTVGYILGGQTTSFGAGDNDAFLVKTDSNGNVTWAKTYGGSNYEQFWSIQPVASGGVYVGYILGGTTSSFGAGDDDGFLVKTDVSGALLWAKTYGGPGIEQITSIQQTSDSGYALGAYTLSFGAGDKDFLLVKTDTSGILQWAKTYGGSGFDELWNSQSTSDGGYVLRGPTSSFGAGGDDGFLVKTDGSGTLLWAKTYGGSGGDSISPILLTSDNGYVLGGYTSSFGAGQMDCLVMKTDALGNLGCCSIDQDVTSLVTTQAHDADLQSGNAVFAPQDRTAAVQAQTKSHGPDFTVTTTDLTPTTTSVCPSTG